jgi:tRNA (mo5U34)-methyltransferase
MSSAEASLSEAVQALGPWFHNIDLRDVATAPNHFLGDYPAVKWRRISHAIPHDLTGKTVLDIGCNGGFYSIEMKRRNAARVVTIDIDPNYLRQVRFAAQVTGVEIEFERLSVYEVAKLGDRFDIVLFLGVIYHLRHPLLALDLIREHAVRDLLICQSMQRGCLREERLAGNHPFSETAIFEWAGFPRLFFIEHCYAVDDTNWWVPNRACMKAMLRSVGFVIEPTLRKRFISAGRPNPPTVLGAVYPAGKPSMTTDEAGG